MTNTTEQTAAHLREHGIDIRHGAWASDVAADLIFTSPPYNIGSKSPRKDGQRKHGKFDAKSYGGITGYPDALPEDEYQDQQEQFLLWCAEHLTSNGTLVYNHKPRRKNGAMIHPAQWFLRPEVTRVLTLMEEVTWDRGSTHNHGRGLLWPHTERLYIFRRADGAYALDNVSGLPQRSDVWRINRPPSTKGHFQRKHACPFSMELAEAVLTAYSREGDLVCDPYSGSGTTAAAALAMGRRFVGTERESNYYADSIRNVAEFSESVHV